MILKSTVSNATPLIKGNSNMLIVEGLAQYGDRLEILPTDSCDAFEIRAWIRDWEKNDPFIPGELMELSFSVGEIPVTKVGQVIAVSKIFDELSKRYSSRKGGYSRVLKAGFRTGDDAPMAVIELVDRNPEAKKVDKPKKVETKDKSKENQTAPKVTGK